MHTKVTALLTAVVAHAAIVEVHITRVDAADIVALHTRPVGVEAENLSTDLSDLSIQHPLSNCYGIRLGFAF